jgi:beta-lactamase regulating signal transducer with metallopeptidase domain/peptidoglycan/xylan/chitin deacetylase (PgdA/CDA1 family)
MSTMQALFSHSFFQAMGWTLVHFIWQGALVGLLYAGASVLLRRNSSNARYAAACSALLLMLILPVATFYIISTSSPRLVSGGTQGAAERARELAASRQATSAATRQQLSSPAEGDPDALLPPEAMTAENWAEDSFASLLPGVVLVWLTGTFLLSLRFFGGWTRAQRLKFRRTIPSTRDWRKMVTRLSRQLRLSRPVRLFESALVEVPTVIGWLRPVILVPVSVLAGLSTQQVEALLAHELAHIRRHDYLVNLLQIGIETLLFYHPAVWWVSHQIRVEREHCCDDLAVRACGDVLSYARALAMLEQLRGAGAREEFSMAASGGSLIKRIRRLIAPPQRTLRRSSIWLACFVVALSVVGLFVGARGTLRSTQAISNATDEERAATRPSRREVAVTFVSLPYMRSYPDDVATVEKTTRRLLKTITSHNIPAVGFVGERAIHRYGEKGPRTAPLKMWLDAGLELGNQTYSHKWLYNTSLEEFQEDVVRGEAVTRQLLRERGLPLRYFLYPYLNTGPDLATKASFEKFLAERGYSFAPVTIDNMDWLFAKTYDEAMERNDQETARRVAQEYVPYMEKMFEFYEQLSVDVVGYEVPQVLMLSASKLNADFLEDLVQMLKRRNYSFVTLEAAMKDQAYQQPDRYTGPVGISWIQRWAITKGMGFRKEPPLPPFMRQFDKRSASRSDFKT